MATTSSGTEWCVDSDGDIDIWHINEQYSLALTNNDLLSMLAAVKGPDTPPFDKRPLYDDLTEAFINYQHRIDHPMPSATETPAVMHLRYNNDPMFRARVMSLTSGVMEIVSKHIDKQETK